MIGHDQEAVVVNAKGLPVLGSVSLQSLIMDETPPPPMPLIDDRPLRPRLSEVCRHHEKNLKDRNTEMDLV